MFKEIIADRNGFYLVTWTSAYVISVVVYVSLTALFRKLRPNITTWMHWWISTAISLLVLFLSSAWLALSICLEILDLPVDGKGCPPGHNFQLGIDSMAASWGPWIAVAVLLTTILLLVKLPKK